MFNEYVSSKLLPIEQLVPDRIVQRLEEASQSEPSITLDKCKFTITAYTPSKK